MQFYNDIQHQKSLEETLLCGASFKTLPLTLRQAGGGHTKLLNSHNLAGAGHQQTRDCQIQSWHTQSTRNSKAGSNRTEYPNQTETYLNPDTELISVTYWMGSVNKLHYPISCQGGGNLTRGASHPFFILGWKLKDMLHHHLKKIIMHMSQTVQWRRIYERNQGQMDWWITVEWKMFLTFSWIKICLCRLM